MVRSPGFKVRIADEGELEAVVRLRWLWATETSGLAPGGEQEFVAEAARWAREHRSTHLAHVALDDNGEVIGMAWLALTPRVPGIGHLDRCAGDLQSCYVLSRHRGRGVGGALVDAVLESARAHGAEHVTVHASERSVSMYARNGFRENERLLWADVTISDR